MKKTILLIALGMSLCANAQLTVLESGQTVVGNPTSMTDVNPDATLNIWNHNTFSSTPDKGASISFGSGSKARMTGYDSKGNIEIYSLKDFTLRSLAENEMVMQWVAAVRTFNFTYDLRAPRYYTSSDLRLKTDVKSLDDSFKGLLEINPVSYRLTQTSSSESTGMKSKVSKDVELEESDNAIQFGFIAQEIQKLYPNLVAEGEDGMLAIDYTGFIPLLVDAYKNLSDKVKEQEDIISALTNSQAPRYIPASADILNQQKALLKQNKPNPFNTSTTIECTVPQDVASALICVYDLQGKQVHRIDIRERGDVVNVIDASCLTPGMYIYSLIADGAEIDSKRMIITD